MSLHSNPDEEEALTYSQSIKYGESVGIFSAGLLKRLDLSTSSLRCRVNATVTSASTRLTIKRLDGPNEGPVCKDHKVGIFTMDGKLRLDISDYSMLEETAATVISDTTTVKIRSATGFEFENRPVKYGDEIGIFIDPGIGSSLRLDIGRDSLKKEAVSARDNRDTTFFILPTDPIIALVNFSGIVYDLTRAVTTSTESKDVECSGGINGTDEESDLELNVVRAEPMTFSWHTSICLHDSFFIDASKDKARNPIPNYGSVNVPMMTADGICYAGKIDFDDGNVDTSANDSKKDEQHMEVQYKEYGNYEFFQDCSYEIGSRMLPPSHEVLIKLEVTTVYYEVPYYLFGQFKCISGRTKKGKMEGIYKGTNSYISKATCEDQPCNDTSTAL